MNFNLYIILSAEFLLLVSGQFYITTLPEGNEVDSSLSSIPFSDVSALITQFLGLSSRSESKWAGITSVDAFNRPKGNLLINLYVPSEIKYTIDRYAAKYKLDGYNNLEMLSIEATNNALTRVFIDRSPMIIYFETDGKLFNVAKYNAPMLNDLPSTLDAVRGRLEGVSIVDDLTSGSCLKLSQDADVYFLGELQMLDDILSQVSKNRNLVEDFTPDSFVFSLTALDGLVRRYGSDSCQVNSALKLLEKFIPQLIYRFNDLYQNRLLSEVNVATPIGRLFNEASARHTRSLQEFVVTATGNDTLGNVADFTDHDYAVTVNLTFWVMVVFALTTLAASYGIWFMNPGWDSVIYRMTTQRLKFD